MLYVITGVRGAGKTTLIDSIKRQQVATILQPSTTRPRRFKGEAEYNFVRKWDLEKYAWTIEYGGYNYGMRKSEIERSINTFCFTVFEPTSIDIFYNYRANERLDAKVIGLDTIRNLKQQQSRVDMLPSRMMTAEQFEAALRKTRDADICIDGDADEILSKIKQLVQPSET
ncbi:hypothetical protein EOB59_30505 [Mesorhizobium sp. M7A.F.Ca.MR.176.00.0.0]|uniref:hypothetical protein n=1 Tax=Mesorhizobium sp. M7A.F.Ca.MR.176.00.0.0 TaxID=2496776 RepID=UPI000FD50BBF|nr:hypothetical protein [Mesorhizobium sp. M7A.F.Ca.MR.176.00.0.0]RUU85964.1 hypothetical protein EOB59_30505 [Mesorhizobium sp. M7A.F.Ca.MR.176.00.0.0]